MITIYSKSWCPHCVNAKNLLDQLEIPYKEIDLTDKPDLIAEISAKSGLMTVPQIFHGDTLIGGNDDLHNLHESGGLLPLLKS